MRNFAILTLFVLGLACHGMGCLKLPPQESAKQNLRNWEQVAPSYKRYVDADARLSADSKRIRKRTLDDYMSLARKLTGETEDE